MKEIQGKNPLSSVSAIDAYSLFDRRIELITEGIAPFFADKLRELSKDNALTIVNYILSMKNEINLSDGYRKLNIYVLYCISNFFENKKKYKEITRDDVMKFLDSFRKPEASNPLHKWIGTYNIYRALFIRFFKWLYYPNVEQKKRPKPNIIENIPLLPEMLTIHPGSWMHGITQLKKKKRMKCAHIF